MAFIVEMSELSNRLQRAVEFIVKNGYAKNNTAIAKKLGVTSSTICMAVKAHREPTTELLATLCDNYPISFDWLRKGEGSMIRGERELALLRRIEELEKEIALLKG